jgi:hypothetical protein
VTASALLPGWEAAGAGFVGGIVPDALRLLNARHEGLPAYLRTWFFWVSLAVLAVLGSLVAVLSHPASVMAALAFGYSAPSIVSTLGAKGGADARLDFKATRKRSALEELRGWWAR